VQCLHPADCNNYMTSRDFVSNHSKAGAAFFS